MADALEQETVPQPRQFLRRRGIALLVLVILTIYGFEAHARRRAMSVPAHLGDQGAYLAYARHLYESNYTVVEDRNRMPVYPFLLSLIYRPGLTEEEFLTRAQVFNVNLSLVLLLLLFLVFRKFFPSLWAVALLAATAFGVFIYRADKVQTEVLFYFVSFIGFVLLVRMLVAPRWWLGVLAGGTMGVAHLTKASVLPALGIWSVLFLLKLLWDFSRGRDRPSFTGWHGAGMLLVVLAAFLTVVFPYIQTSKRIYGHYFYNVNSTFVMWCDSSTEGWEFINAHAIKDEWRTLPPEQLPSPAKYWREHSIRQIARRLFSGSLDLATQNARAIGYYKFVVVLLATGLFLCLRRTSRIREVLVRAPFAAAFCVLFFLAYFVLYAWYDAIVNDTRFVLSIFLPFLFAASILAMRLGSSRVISFAARQFAFEQFFPGLLLGLALIDVLYNTRYLAH
jgi:hypothetical protein